MTKKKGPRYAIIPFDAVTSEALTGRDDLRILALLGRHIDRNGWCSRTQGRMAKELGIARGTLQRALGRLVEAGFVEVRHSKRMDGGQGANRYRVILDDAGRVDQLDLFFDPNDDAARSSAEDEAEELFAREAPLPHRQGTPLPRLAEAPPASPRRSTLEERPLHQTSPLRAAAAAQPRDEPANDRMATVVALPDLHVLKDTLRGAAGEAINTASPAFIPLTEPIAWLANGCDLALDIVPTIRGLADRHRGSPIRSWRYFSDAVFQARDRRLEAAEHTSKLPSQHASFDRPAGRRSSSSNSGDAHGRPHRNAAAARHESHLGLAEELARYTGRLPRDVD